MNVLLWIIQILLGVAFVVSGAGKFFPPGERAREQQAYREDFTPAQLRGIGALEVLGGLGVVLPWATGIATFLTPLAAAGLGLIMIGAAVVHRRRKEGIAVNLVLLAMAVIVVAGRF
ncbi:LPXTG-motif cell wall anchor domain-containing protein/MYXO-CTERM domain-containing protein [Nonomuraea solani]|uniref:LPXTG-motif cell wall anchor domain-containing protein/MYXO-CTERM domain-containing protein n=1 Tax=Nonomuraea solani TaxID=1144553 RepID=A0A1H6F211_9ACTN|nr:DoxX family protein [Nonomuraea solani]SEH03401.1 LPXTG-motif cell wall anchor domain-containing protein/MYXO-CTERM domain-containing protein [Nonomuraea solani]